MILALCLHFIKKVKLVILRNPEIRKEDLLIFASGASYITTNTL